MNTASEYIPFVPLNRFRENEIALEDLEFLFPKDQLEKITAMHNDGVWVEDIAKYVKRDEYEVLIAIVHQHRKGLITRELAFRRKSI